MQHSLNGHIAPAGFSFLSHVQHVARRAVDQSSVLRRLKVGERSQIKQSVFALREPGAKEKSRRSLQRVAESVDLPTLKQDLADYFVECFLVESRPPLWILTQSGSLRQVEAGALSTCSEDDDLHVPFRSLRDATTELRRLSRGRPGRFPHVDVLSWSLRCPGVDTPGTSPDQETMGPFAPLLLRNEDLPSIDALIAFEEIVHADDQVFDMSRKSGPKSFKKEKVVSVLRTLFPDDRPKLREKELTKIVQDFLRDVDGCDIKFGRSTLLEAISTVYGAPARQKPEE